MSHYQTSKNRCHVNAAREKHNAWNSRGFKNKGCTPRSVKYSSNELRTTKTTIPAQTCQHYRNENGLHMQTRARAHSRTPNQCTPYDADRNNWRHSVWLTATTETDHDLLLTHTKETNHLNSSPLNRHPNRTQLYAHESRIYRLTLRERRCICSPIDSHSSPSQK